MSEPDIVISLFDRTGNMVRDWADAGYECWCVDTQHSIRRERIDGNIHYVWGDARSWHPPENRNLAILFAFFPCTHVARSGARDFETKGLALLQDSIELFNAARQAGRWARCPYMIENPVGVLSSLSHIGKPNHYFDPCDFAGYLPEDEQQDEAYTKRTCLWVGGGFVMPEPRRVEPTLGSKMYKLPPGDDRADLRAVTPRGFSRAVFEANAKVSVAT